MKTKQFVVLFFSIVSIHLSHSQSVRTQDTCLAIYGTGTILVNPEVATINFSLVGLRANVVGGWTYEWEGKEYYFNPLRGAIRQLGNMDTSSHESYGVWPNAVKYINKKDSICIDFVVMLDDPESVGEAVRVLSEAVDAGPPDGRLRISKVSYSVLDESNWRAEAYKKAIDNAREKAESSANTFNFVLGKILFIEEVPSSSLEQFEPSVWLKVTSNVKVVYSIWQ